MTVVVSTTLDGTVVTPVFGATVATNVAAVVVVIVVAVSFVTFDTVVITVAVEAGAIAVP